MFCPECGTQLADGTLACYKCGAMTSYGKQMASAQGTQQAASVPAQQQVQAPMQSQPQPAVAVQQPAQQQPVAQPQPAVQAQPGMQQPYQQQPGTQGAQPSAQQAYQQPQPQPGVQQPYQQPGQQPYGAPQPGQTVLNAEVIDKYKSLGGWLLFFLICEGLSAATNLRDVAESLRLMGSYGGVYLVSAGFEALLSLALAVFSLVFIVFVVQRKRSFLQFYQITTIVRIVLAAISVAISGLLLGEFGTEYVGVALGAGLITAVGAGALSLWLMTMYYCKSQRVRIYMGSTEYLDKALFKVGVN